jgi:hypothetical protein
MCQRTFKSRAPTTSEHPSEQLSLRGEHFLLLVNCLKRKQVQLLLNQRTTPVSNRLHKPEFNAVERILSLKTA